MEIYDQKETQKEKEHKQKVMHEKYSRDR